MVDNLTMLLLWHRTVCMLYNVHYINAYDFGIILLIAWLHIHYLVSPKIYIAGEGGHSD